ncbi:hypothetical protein F4678DRAFT_474889 [Xylaria arbuscula]|nr:hypothetical protein F4678DRAFT_474889 [Xylaria arbuscula]
MITKGLICGLRYSSYLNRATCCAVSGKGEPWCLGPPIGFSHLYEFFNAWLFSIYFCTLQVCVFVLYNASARFNRQKALNIAAEKPSLDVILPSISRIATFGTGTPFDTRFNFSATLSSRSMQAETVISGTGDPSHLTDASTQGGLENKKRCKRKGLEDCQVNNETSFSQHDQIQKNKPKDYITV